MTESAPTAPSTESKKAEPENVLERIELWVQDHPEATEYLIEGEEEAAMILLAMAATIKLVTLDMHPGADKDQVRDIAAGYRRAVTQGKATEAFRAMTEADQLELYGLKLVMRRILLQ